MTRRASLLVAILSVLASLFAWAPAPVLAATPVAIDDGPIVVQKDAGPSSIDVLANDTVAADATISATGDPAHGTVAVAGDGRTLTYDPDQGYAGPDTFDYTVTDPNGPPETATDTATVTIKVNAPPVAGDNPSAACDNPESLTFAMPEDMESFIAGGPCNLLANDTDSDGTVVNWELVTPPQHGDVTNELPLPLPGLSSDFAYVPDADYFTNRGDGPGGSWISDSFTYRAIDNDGGRSAPATVRFWIAPVNDPPTFTPGAATITSPMNAAYSQPWASAISAGPANESSQSVHFEPDLPFANAALFNVQPALSASGGLSFVPAAGQTGSATVTFVAKDDGGLEDYGGNAGGAIADDTSEPVTFTITISASGATLVATDDTATVAEDVAATAIAVLANDTGTAPLAITAVTQGAKGSVAITGGGSGLTYQPNAQAFGSDAFTYTLTDGDGGSATASVNVTITAANDAPNAVNDGVSSPFRVYIKAGPKAIPVLANDTSLPDAPETLRITAVSQGGHGTVAITGGGTGLTYAAKGTVTGIDLFTYTISDGHGGFDTATVQVTVGVDTTAPKAAIVTIQKSTIAGRPGALRIYVKWSLTESQSGLASQLLQRRTDAGSWVTVSLASLSTRAYNFALTKGHLYTFRIRATDKAGNVGAFASRGIRI